MNVPESVQNRRTSFTNEVTITKYPVKFIQDKAVLVTVYPSNVVNIWSVQTESNKSSQSLSLHSFHLEQSIIIKRPRVQTIGAGNCPDSGDICYLHVPHESVWCYIGTVKGDIYVVNILEKVKSSYWIDWSMVMPQEKRYPPGSVVHISEHPSDSDLLLLGFQKGLIALWSLSEHQVISHFMLMGSGVLSGGSENTGTTENEMNETKTATFPSQLTSICWSHEGQQFISAHFDGSLIVWNSKIPEQGPAYRKLKISPEISKAVNEVVSSDYSDFHFVYSSLR